MQQKKSSLFVEEEQFQDIFHFVLFYPPEQQHIQSYKNFEIQLNKIRTFLKTLFCNADELNAGESIFPSIFRQASAIRLKTLKIALLSLLICFRREKFVQDLKKFQNIEFTSQRKQYIKTIVNIISNYPTTNINNSISDIEECIPEIVAKEFTFMKGVFSCIGHKQARRMFYQYLMNPSENVQPSELTQSLKKLTLYFIQQWQQNGVNQNSIFKLKSASQKPAIRDRYYYSFLWEIQNKNKGKQNQYDCWLVVVQTTRPIKQQINIDKRLLQKQAFLGIDQKQSAQLQNIRSSIKKSRIISQIIEQQEKQFQRLSQIFEEPQNKNQQNNKLQLDKMSPKGNKKGKSQQKSKVSTSQIKQSSEQLQKDWKARQQQIQPKEPKTNVPNQTTPDGNEQNGKLKFELGEVHNSFNFNTNDMSNEYRFLAFVTVFILVMLFFNVIYV